MTGTVDPCPHVCAACPEHHKTTTEETGTMTEPHDTDTEITIGIDAQGNPVTVDRAAWIKMTRGDEPAVMRSYWRSGNASSGHGKSNILKAKLAELAWQGRENFSGRLLSDGTEIWRTFTSRPPVTDKEE